MVAQGCKVLVAMIAMLVLWTGAASALQPIEPLGGQLRLTAQGPVSDAAFDVNDADVAYNSVRNQFLLVWEQTGGGETEIFGRILNGDGPPAGDPFRISRTVLPDTPGLDSSDPAVAHDPELDRYGVVWSGENDTASENEIMLQTLAGDGTLISRISGMPSTTPMVVSDIGPENNTLH
jgi:hypothetical protein